jgi:ABC-2 type transport system permease protein
MDRLLASPVRRGAMMNGTLAYQSLVCTVQTLIVFGVAYLMGGRFNWSGIVVTTVAAVLLTLIFAALSNAVALLVRPLDWAVVAARETLATAPDWAAVWPRFVALVAVAAVMGWLATRAFGAYQRSA